MSGDLRIFTSPVSPSVVGEEGPVVLQYDWTWTMLIEPSLSREDAPPDLRYTTRGDDLGRMQVRHFDYKQAAVDGRVSVLYVGEKPRLLGIVRPQGTSPLANDPDRPLYQSLAARMREAIDDPPRRYFLMQELEFNPNYGGLNWSDDRLQHFFSDSERRAVCGEILDRLGFRKVDPAGSGFTSPDGFQQRLMGDLVKRLTKRGAQEPPATFTPLSLAHKRLLIGLTQVFRTALPHDDPKAWDEIHNEFSAGNLISGGQIQGLDNSIVGGVESRAGEPDSSAVMLYAELALAMYEYGQESSKDRDIVDAAAFWGRLLNSMVQMQAVYFHRFARTFSDCNADRMRRPDPLSDYQAVIEPIRGFRGGPGRSVTTDDEVEQLRQRMRCHAMYLAQYVDMDPF